MTKEELKQEAKVYSYKLYHSKAWNPGEDMLVKAYIAGAEPREKRIAELETRCNELFLQTCEQAEKIKELEAQIEKMKCCKNCIYQGECDLSGYEECKNFDKWEIKEK